MILHVDQEQFKVECNRYKHVGEVTYKYPLINNKTVNIVYHTKTKKVPDLKQFKRFHVTGLVHNLDSQVADYICKHLEWCIDIHDAFIVHPNQASLVRSKYAEKLEHIYNNRGTILTNYFKSIGIGAEALSQWLKVKALVTPVTEFKCASMALK